MVAGRLHRDKEGETEVNLQQCEFPPRTRHPFEEQLFQLPPWHSKHSHNSQGKAEASAQWEDAKSCQTVGNTNTQPGFCLCLLKAVQQKQQLSGFYVASSKNRTGGKALESKVLLCEHRPLRREASAFSARDLKPGKSKYKI